MGVPRQLLPSGSILVASAPQGAIPEVDHKCSIARFSRGDRLARALYGFFASVALVTLACLGCASPSEFPGKIEVVVTKSSARQSGERLGKLFAISDTACSTTLVKNAPPPLLPAYYNEGYRVIRSPDGKFGLKEFNFGSQYYLISLASDEAVTLPGQRRFARPWAWSPNGALLAISFLPERHYHSASFIAVIDPALNAIVFSTPWLGATHTPESEDGPYVKIGDVAWCQCSKSLAVLLSWETYRQKRLDDILWSISGHPVPYYDISIVILNAVGDVTFEYMVVKNLRFGYGRIVSYTCDLCRDR
ncbi:MAG: hypothetical protein L0Z55_10680 [Planctomycetes bacterium]|nr:hypothetical protein [Planctomycetota bacterium]